MQGRTTGTRAVSYRPPPIPEQIRLTFDRATWQQYPRWYPTIPILRCLEQLARQSAQLSPDDAVSVYMYCKKLSGGLQSGQKRDYDKPIPAGVSVLFYQEQSCKCHTMQSSSCSTKEKNVCHGSNRCVPFILIVQEDWQRKFASDFRAALRILFMDETHQVNQWRWPMTCIGGHDLHGNFIPLATMICSASDQACFEIFLRQVKASCHGDLDSVRVFMVDKAEAERNAIHAVFPECITRLCYWHGIEALRRWVVKATNGVNDKADQQLIKDVFKRLVFAETEADFNSWFTYLETYLGGQNLRQVTIFQS